MDNVTLSKEQLHLLIGFIRKRGFREPMVIVEILDHFACKVEEKIKNNPSLSFDEAMMAAHGDFGVMGFQPIATTFNSDIKKRYKKVYREELKKVLQNPLAIITIIASCTLYYKGFVWSELNNCKVIGINVFGILAYLGIVILVPFLSFYKYRRRDSPIMSVLFSRAYWAYLVLVSVSFQFSEERLNARQLLFSSFMGTFGVCFAVVALFTMRRAVKRGYDDSKIVYDYFETVQSLN